MHVEHVVGAGALVQVVDVLGDERQPTAAALEVRLQSCEGRMRRVRLGRERVAAALVVEVLHRLRIASEGFGRGELHGIELRPEAGPGPVAEGAHAALGRNAGAGQDDDVHVSESPLASRHHQRPAGASNPIARFREKSGAPKDAARLSI